MFAGQRCPAIVMSKGRLASFRVHEKLHRSDAHAMLRPERKSTDTGDTESIAPRARGPGPRRGDAGRTNDRDGVGVRSLHPGSEGDGHDHDTRPEGHASPAPPALYRLPGTAFSRQEQA